MMQTPLHLRSGISLVEVLVAITLLGIVATSLGGLAFTAARQSVTAAGSGYRQGILMGEVNRLTALPWSQLPAQSGCITSTQQPMPYTRCVGVSDLSSTRRRVTIVVTPSVPGVRPDTAVLERTNPPDGSPLGM